MRKAVIIDDELSNCLTLEKMVEKFVPNVHVAGHALSVDQGYELINQEQPELVFLDIEMPLKNGFDLLEMFDSPQFVTVFTTAHANYAIRALKMAAFDFLLKPIDLIELKSCVNRIDLRLSKTGLNLNYDRSLKIVLQQTDNQQDGLGKIALPTSDCVEYIDLADLVRCQADRVYCHFFLASGRRILVSKPLKEYERILQSKGFLRVHNSHIVSLRYVRKLIQADSTVVQLSTGEEVPVSNRRTKSLVRELGGDPATIDELAELD